MSDDARGREARVGAGDHVTTVRLVVDAGQSIELWRLDETALPFVTIIDVLCRLHLVARARGWRIEVRAPSPGLRMCVELVGLDGVVSVEVLGEAEGGEQLRVQEVVQPGDPPLDDLDHLE
jgi:hypothetical protein